MAIFVEQLKGWVAPADAFTSFYGELQNSFWLDREWHDSEPFSVIGTGAIAQQAAVEKFLNSSANQSANEMDSLPFTFRPGLVGVFEYEAGRDRSLDVAHDKTEFAGAVGKFLVADRAMLFDHRNRHIYFIAEMESEPEFRDWYHAALLRLALIGGNSKLWCHSKPKAEASTISLHLDKTEYLAAIAKAKVEIASGNSYQLCLTNRMRGEYSGDPLSYFLELRTRHQAPYAGFFKVDGVALASISPERLLSIRGSKIWSSPIKGTRARGPHLNEAEIVMELGSDLKERAENLMIVDLLRNDLQRVCKPSSVTVAELLEVKTYSTMHQLVSEVTGELAEDATMQEVLAACFPAGSMTGAPKFAAMEILKQLEVADRGLYSGGFGFLTGHGDLDLGMVIRTVVFDSGSFEIGVGGGLTSDSDPEREYQEMLLKAEALIENLNIRPGW